MNDSPASILFNTDGYEVAINEGTVVESEQSGVLLAGKDGYEEAKFVRIIDEHLLVSSVSKSIVGNFFAGSDLIAGSSSLQILVSIYNPLGSGRVIYISYMDVNGVISATFTTPFLYKIVKTTNEPTGGTIFQSQKGDSTDSNAVAVVRISPTASINTNALWSGVSTLSGNDWINKSKTSVSFDTTLDHKELAIYEGEGLAIIASANSTDWAHYINLRWSES